MPSPVCAWSYVLLNITKIQQPSVMPLLSNLMLHACCPSIMDSYLRAGPLAGFPTPGSRWCEGLGGDQILWTLFGHLHSKNDGGIEGGHDASYNRVGLTLAYVHFLSQVALCRNQYRGVCGCPSLSWNHRGMKEELNGMFCCHCSIWLSSEHQNSMFFFMYYYTYWLRGLVA